LSVLAIRHRFLLIVHQDDMSNNVVWDILNYVSFDRESDIPSVMLPIIKALVEVDRSNHLSYTADLTAAIKL
jgi:hypothetical protein